jgi:hypothetical protein
MGYCLSKLHPMRMMLPALTSIVVYVRGLEDIRAAGDTD